MDPARGIWYKLRAVKGHWEHVDLGRFLCLKIVWSRCALTNLFTEVEMLLFNFVGTRQSSQHFTEMIFVHKLTLLCCRFSVIINIFWHIETSSSGTHLVVAPRLLVPYLCLSPNINHYCTVTSKLTATKFLQIQWFPSPLLYSVDTVAFFSQLYYCPNSCYWFGWCDDIAIWHWHSVSF